VSIGDTLAEARRQAGLTITQVSQQTRIRESIIRGIEQGDFTTCGGDFYARGHIRSIAGVVGVDPAPLIREYDEEHGPPGSMRASEIFEPATPIKIREPRQLHLGRVLVAVLVALILFGGYRLYETSRTPSATPAPSTHTPSATAKASTAAKPVTHVVASPPEAVIKLIATQDCWVGLTSATGQQLYQGTITAGNTVTWHEKHPITMVIGNPPGITLTVNGKTEPMNTVQVVRLNINPFTNPPVAVG
jgi:cytoskeletal protein RodZ